MELKTKTTILLKLENLKEDMITRLLETLFPKKGPRRERATSLAFAIWSDRFCLDMFPSLPLTTLQDEKSGTPAPTSRRV